MSDYDNLNRGALFPTGDKKLVRQGQIHFGETPEDIAIIQVTTKTGKTVFEVYKKIGAVFANTNKTSDKAPDMSGTIAYGGLDYQMAGWKYTSKNGLPYTSVSVTPPENKADNNEGQFADDLDSEIPF
jgi:uncharacterized protein (DUF736 family)